MQPAPYPPHRPGTFTITHKRSAAQALTPKVGPQLESLRVAEASLRELELDRHTPNEPNRSLVRSIPLVPAASPLALAGEWVRVKVALP